MLETVQARLDHHPEKMTMRRSTAEHPFGTIKCWMGCNALSYEEAAESRNRDGAQCARLQHEARDGDHRRGRAAGGLGDVSRELHAEISPHREALEASGRLWVGQEDTMPATLRSARAKTVAEAPTTTAARRISTAWAMDTSAPEGPKSRSRCDQSHVVGEALRKTRPRRWPRVTRAAALACHVSFGPIPSRSDPLARRPHLAYVAAFLRLAAMRRRPGRPARRWRDG